MQAGRRVQADGIADAGVLARIVGQQDGDALVLIRDAAAAWPSAGPGRRRARCGRRAADSESPRSAGCGSWASVFLKETAVVMIRPSNSGRATFMARSRGSRPASWRPRRSRWSSRRWPAGSARPARPAREEPTTLKLVVVSSTSIDACIRTSRALPRCGPKTGQDVQAALLEGADQRIDWRQVAGHPVGSIEDQPGGGPIDASQLPPPAFQVQQAGMVGMVDADLG